MADVSSTLFQMALRAVYADDPLMVKAAVTPGDGGGGAPAPPMGGGMPPGMMPPGGGGGQPPPMDPMAMMGAGAVPGMPPGQQPVMPGMGGMGGMPGGMGQPAQQKIKPEQMMQMLDFRLYNMQQQLTAIMTHLGATIPPGALVLPPGSPVSPPAEAALPGGPQDPSQQAGAQPGGGQQSAIPPIEGIQGAAPGMGGGGGGGGEKAGFFTGAPNDFLERLAGASSDNVANDTTPAIVARNTTADNVAAVAALLRSHTVNH